MGRLTAGQMVTELQRRIAQLGDDVALAAIDRAYQFVCAQGSYTFLLNGNVSGTPSNLVDTPDTGAFALPADCDLGKALFVANSPQGTPIEKKGIQDFSLSFGINIPTNQGYSVYHITGRNLLLRPTQSSQTIGVRYHNIVAPLGLGDVPLTPDEFDDTIVGFAEAAERRINDVGDSWPQLYQQKAAEIKQMLEEYRSTSEQTGSVGDAQQAIQEKTSTGRG